MPASHERSQSQGGLFYRSTSSNKLDSRSSSPLLRLVRPSSSSLSKSSNAFGSSTKSGSLYSNAPAFIPEFLKPSGNMTPQSGSPRASTANPMTAPKVAALHILDPSTPPTARNRRRSASVPYRNETKRSGILPNTLESMSHTRHSRRPLETSPSSMFSVQDDPFRYSPGQDVKASSAISLTSLADPFVAKDRESPHMTTAKLNDVNWRAKAKSSPNLAQSLRDRALKQPPLRSNSAKSPSKSPEIHMKTHPTLPNHLSFQVASPASLRSTPPLGGPRSPRLIRANNRSTPVVPEVTRNTGVNVSKRIALPIFAAYSPSRTVAEPHGLGISSEGFSKHVRPMLTRSSSDSYSFKMVAMYGKQSEIEIKNSASDASLRPARNQTAPNRSAERAPPHQSSREKPKNPYGPVQATRPLHIRNARSKSNTFVAQGHNVTKNPSLASTAFPAFTKESSDDIPFSMSDDLGDTSTTGALSESDTVGDLSFDKASATTSSLSSMNTVPSTNSLLTRLAVDPDPTTWLSVIPPSPTKDSSRRRGLIFNPELILRPPARSPSPSLELEDEVRGTVIDSVREVRSGKESLQIRLSTNRNSSGNEDSYGAVTQALDSYYEGADASGNTIKPPSVSSLIELGASFLPSPGVSSDHRSHLPQQNPATLSTSSLVSSENSDSITSYYQTPMSTALKLSLHPSLSSSPTSLFFPKSLAAAAKSSSTFHSIQSRMVSPSSSSSSLPIVPRSRTASMTESRLNTSINEPLAIESSLRSRATRSPSPSPSHTSFLPSQSSPLAQWSSSSRRQSASSEDGGTGGLGDLSISSISAKASSLWADRRTKLKAMLTFHGRTDQDESLSGTDTGAGGSSSATGGTVSHRGGVAGMMTSVRTPGSKRAASKARAKDDMELSINDDAEEGSPKSASSSFVSRAGGRRAGHQRGGSLGGLGMFSRIISLQSSPGSSSGMSESGILGERGGDDFASASRGDDSPAHVGTGLGDTSSGPHFITADVDVCAPPSASSDTTRVSESAAWSGRSVSRLGVTSALKRITRKMI